MLPHEKIISDCAKDSLIPQGFFRKGRSRTYLNDNGYFFIQLEFQPRSYLKGTFLNVGISFLWQTTEGLDSDLAYCYDSRLEEFREFKDDEIAFSVEVNKMIASANKKILEYLEFNDLAYAKNRLLKRKEEDKYPFWDVYYLAMLCFLAGDFEEGLISFNEFISILKSSFKDSGDITDWQVLFYNKCQSEILPRLTSKEFAQNWVIETINRRRDMFLKKTSFAKMNKTWKPPFNL